MHRRLLSLAQAMCKMLCALLHHGQSASHITSSDLVTNRTDKGSFESQHTLFAGMGCFAVCREPDQGLHQAAAHTLRASGDQHGAPADRRRQPGGPVLSGQEGQPCRAGAPGAVASGGVSGCEPAYLRQMPSGAACVYNTCVCQVRANALGLPLCTAQASCSDAVRTLLQTRACG